MLYLISDHGGYALKNEIASWLKEQSVEFSDLGATKYLTEDDYPDYGKKLTETMDPQKDMAVALCASGQGICLAIARVKQFRPAQCWSAESAKHARSNDNANVLCLAGKLKNIDSPVDIVRAFLKTEFKNEEKYLRRIDKLDL